jgi:hypothetical protein
MRISEATKSISRVARVISFGVGREQICQVTGSISFGLRAICVGTDPLTILSQRQKFRPSPYAALALFIHVCAQGMGRPC